MEHTYKGPNDILKTLSDRHESDISVHDYLENVLHIDSADDEELSADDIVDLLY